MNRFGRPCKPLMWSISLLLAAFVAGCGSSGSGSGSGADPVFGVDVSAFKQRQAIRWTSVASTQVSYGGLNYPISFVILRASKGNADVDDCRFKDPDFTVRAPDAASANLKVGTYHVASIIKDEVTHEMYSPASEAAFFVSVAGNWIKAGNMRPFLDVEDALGCAKLSELADADLVDWVDQWMQEVQRLTGVTPIIYVNVPFVAKLQSLASKYELWGVANACVRTSECDPGNPLQRPSWNVDLVQYDWHGHVSGVVEEVDL